MNNPVAWQMWGPEAIALAKKSNRLLFVSIGYAACHCRFIFPHRSARGTAMGAKIYGLCRVSCHGTRVVREPRSR